jgi:predicted NUDIX family phosphoesterase
VSEEIYLDSPYAERAIGLINDDRTPVGQVHLGIVHVFDLEQPAVRQREDALTESGFASLDQLRENLSQLETWSQLLLDGPWLEQF